MGTNHTRERQHHTQDAYRYSRHRRIDGEGAEKKESAKAVNKHSGGGVRDQARLASREDTTAEQLDELANASAAFVRIAVAKHPNTWASTIERLAQDEDVEVIATALVHPRCRGDVVRASMTHADPMVRCGVASSSHATVEMLNNLLDDPDEDVVRHALGNPNLNMIEANYRFDTLTDKMRKALAGNPALSEQLQWKFARDLDWHLRLTVASIENIAPHVAEYLSQDSHAIVRQRVAGNRHVPEEVRRALILDPEDAVAYAASINSQSTVARIVADYQYRR
jgi:hypothetical protein